MSEADRLPAATRAAALAASPSAGLAPVESARVRQFCTFLAGDSRFGVDILSVREINAETTCTAIRHAPPEVRGYVNIRGQIQLVLDINRLLGCPPCQPTPRSRVILFKEEEGPFFGILVDAIGDVVAVEERDLEAYRPVEGGEGGGPMEDQRAAIVDGICRLDDGLLMTLRPAAFLRVLERLLEDRQRA